MAHYERIVNRIKQTFCADQSGTVEQGKVIGVLGEFNLNPQEVGKHVRTAFPNVTVRHGKGKRETVYQGIATRQPLSHAPSTTSFQTQDHTQPLLHPGLMPSHVSQFHAPTASPCGQMYYSQQEVLTMMNMYQYELEQARAINVSLREQLEAARTFRLTEVTQVIKKEMKLLTASSSPISKTVTCVEDIRSFSIEDTSAFLQQAAPTIRSLITTLIQPQYNRVQDQSDQVATLIMATIANHNSQRTNGLQTIIGLMLVARTSNDQVIQVLNHAGLSVSSTKVWNVIKDNAKRARMETKLTREEMWAYDNVNILKRVRQVRKEKHAEMFNWTSRVAVPLRRNPEGLSSVPQGERRNLTVRDVLPSPGDEQDMESRLFLAVKAFVNKTFKPFSESTTPTAAPTQRWIPKMSYRPLELMEEDEAKTSDNVRILQRFATEAGMEGEHYWDQLVVGDQATCKNIRGAGKLRWDEDEDTPLLAWVKETPGDFHFLWEVGKCILLAHSTSSRDVGSLGFLKDLVDRRTLDWKGSNFNVLDDFLHQAHDSHLTAALMAHMGLESLSDTYQGEETVDDICHSFLQTYILGFFGAKHRDKHDDACYNLCTSLLYHLLLYVDLRQAIRYENGPAIVAHWSFWLTTFLGTGRTQYSTEAANFICNLKADWSEAVSNLATHNRTINIHGREGHGKSIDMLVEHYNKILKAVLKGSGGHLTPQHAKDASLAVPMLDEARKFCAKLFSTGQTVRHTTPSADRDKALMIEAIAKGKTYNVIPGRRLLGDQTFKDPIVKGMAKITEDKWFENFVRKEDGRQRQPQVILDTDVNFDGENEMEEEAEDTPDDDSDDESESDNDDPNTDLLMDE